MSALDIPTARTFVPLLAPARYKGAWGGRGGAKSHFFAGLMIEENISQKLDNVCLREVQKSLKFSAKKLLENKIQEMNAGSYFEVQDKIIYTKLGGVIIFEGMQNHTDESIKSLEGFDRAWVEEAQSLSQSSLDKLRPTIRKPGSELWFSWNPKKPTDPVDSLLRGGDPPPGAVVVKSLYSDNPWLPQVLQDEMEYDRRRDNDKFTHIWLGGYDKHSEARVFKNWKIEEFDVDPSALIRQGADWGFSVDPTVLVQSYIVGRTLYIPYEAYRVGCEIKDTPSLFMGVPNAEKWPITADSSRPETISHMVKNGFPKMVRAVKGPGSLEEGIVFLQSFDIVVHPRCQHVIDELTAYRYKTDPITQEVLPILEDKNNHTIDALRYACEGARRAKVKIPPKEKPKPERFPVSNAWMGN